MTVIARTPDLGLVLRLQRPGVCVPCVPAIGAAGWWDPLSQGYTASTAVGETPHWNRRCVWWGQVNGKLCDGDVTWALHWDGEGDGPLVVPVGRAIVVATGVDANGVQTGDARAGVLTATASVRIGAAVTAVAPITLVITEVYN